LLAVLNYGIGLFTNAQDARHGYSVDPWLTADQGIERVMSLEHKCVISLATAQRLAKIVLLRNRLGAGSTTITMGLSAYQAIPCDVIQLNFAPRGWVNQLFEITGVQFRPDYADDGPPRLVVDLTIQETDPAIYEWQPAPVGGSPINDELDINDTPTGQMTQYSYQVQAPTNVAVTDSISTAVTTPDGVTRPRLSVSWTPATDAYVTQYQKQIQLVGSPTWARRRPDGCGEQLSLHRQRRQRAKLQCPRPFPHTSRSSFCLGDDQRPQCRECILSGEFPRPSTRRQSECTEHGEDRLASNSVPEQRLTVRLAIDCR
jgi:hypothetical protein